MKRDAGSFWFKGLFAFLAVLVAGLGLMWLVDVGLNGLLLDFITQNATRFSTLRGAIVTYGVAAFTLLALAVSLTGTLCARSVYKKEHQKLMAAQEDARRAQELSRMEVQRKSDLITYLAHDLKTPLASVIAYLELMHESPELPPQQRDKYVGIALNKANRLEQLIGELFEIIRFNLQTLSLNREKIHLRLMLEQLADEFYPILRAQSKGVKVDCEPDITLRADPDKLARVFNNILKNAAAYSDSDSDILISVRRAEGGLSVCFVNQGDPIPPEKQRLIFEKFYRLDSARSSATGGAGLGLAIAQEIVRAHGGEITVKSGERHTAFTVSLPEDA